MWNPEELPISFVPSSCVPGGTGKAEAREDGGIYCLG